MYFVEGGVGLLDKAHQELESWVINLDVWNGRSFFRQSLSHVVTVTTEASEIGYGVG